MDYNLRSLTSFTALVESHGRVAETQVLAFERHQHGVPELGGEPIIYVERLRLADGQPVILERRHFLAKFCFMPFVTEEIWSLLPVENKNLLIVTPWPKLF